LYVSKLKVYNYRNLRDQTVELHNGPVYITGRNGNGKTNLVEALYLLSGSRSFRTNTQSELVQWGKKEASVFGTVVTKTGAVELGIAISLGQKQGQRTAFKNGEPQGSIAELMGSCSVIAFSPADLSLVKGSPAGRRKFLDRHMVDLQPAFLNVLMAYQRALESKSALLKSPATNVRDLEPWNELLVEYGGKIVDNRHNFLEQLIKKSSPLHHDFAHADGRLELRLESDFIKSEQEGVLSPGELRREFERVAAKEIALRSCVLGPHRDDVAITLAEVDSRAYASQGQTRSIVLALKLGVIELIEERLGEPPIVVLDDVDSELDAERTEHLFRALAHHERQIFITGTGAPPHELSQPGRPAVQRVEVQSGEIV
jgi:DNA replication and repair protein RecF